MTHLNNILFEGVVTVAPCEEETEKGRAVVFALENERGEKKLTLPIIAYGDLVDKVLEHIPEGIVARVLGEVVDEFEGIGILAQHIEYRRKAPTRKSL